MNTPLQTNRPQAQQETVPASVEQPQAHLRVTAASIRRFRIRFVVQVLLCVVPSAILLGAGQVTLGGVVLWVIFGVLFLRLLILGKPAELLCLLIALSPMLNLMKEFAFTYQIITAISVVAVVHYAVRAPLDFRSVLKSSSLTVFILGFAIIYYVVSLLLTGAYEVNLRYFDLVFMVLAVLIVGRSKELLSASFFGLVISAWAVGIAMLQHIDSSYGSRLGIMVVDGKALGNPVSLGTPLALCFLGLALDRGRWFGLRTRSLQRILLIIPTFMLLAITTSRAAWLVTAGGVLVALVFDRRSRMRMLMLIGLGIVILRIVFFTPFGEGLQAGIDRTFGDDRSTASRSSGRSDQWVVSYYAVTSSVGALVHGYGPGFGPRTYAKFSKVVPGVTYAVGWEAQLHSLYLQIAVETGLIGFLPFLCWLGVGLVKNIARIPRSRLIFPLVCFLGYAIIITTVSGNDSVTGIFLGIGLLATLGTGQSRMHPAQKKVTAPISHH
jgi:O-antigen ligase